MGYDIAKKDIKTLLGDDKLIAHIVRKITADKEALENLAGDVAEELASSIEDNPGIKKRLVKAALSNPKFKKKVIKELVDGLEDD